VRRVHCPTLSCLSLFWAATAYAGTVGIVRPGAASPELLEARTRLHGELLSVGLEVTLLDPPTEQGELRTEAPAWLETLAAGGQVDAVIEIVGNTAPVAANVWVIEKAPHRVMHSRIVLESKARNPAETLAIRAVEVLRSTFLEHDMIARRHAGGPSPSPTPASTPSAPRAPSAPSARQKLAIDDRRIGIELGAAALSSLDGLGFAIAPLSRLGWRVRPGFVLQVSFAGLGTRPTATTREGSARITQEYGTLGGWFGLHSHGRLRSFCTLSTGVLHTSIEGQAVAPRQAHDASRWSLLLEGSLGERLHLSESYYLTFAAHVQLAAPYVAVHIVDTVAATSGRPNLALTLTAGAWL